MTQNDYPEEKACNNHQKKACKSNEAKSLLVFIARCDGDFSSWHWVGRAWCEAGTPHFSGGDSAAKDIPPNFYLQHMSVGRAHPVYTLPS